MDGAGPFPRVLSIQSHVVHGYVGNKCAIFPLQLLGFDVDPIFSVQFSNHTGYPSFHGQVFNGDNLMDIAKGLEENGLLSYSHILTGYIGNPSLLDRIVDIYAMVRARSGPGLTYVCDPVLGDEGRLYVQPSMVDLYRIKVLPIATVITPNQFEAELLSGMTIVDEATALKAMVSDGVDNICLCRTCSFPQIREIEKLGGNSFMREPGEP